MPQQGSCNMQRQEEQNISCRHKAVSVSLIGMKPIQELSGQRSDTISKLVLNVAVMIYCNLCFGRTQRSLIKQNWWNGNLYQITKTFFLKTGLFLLGTNTACFKKYSLQNSFDRGIRNRTVETHKPLINRSPVKIWLTMAVFASDWHLWAACVNCQSFSGVREAKIIYLSLISDHWSLSLNYWRGKILHMIRNS